MAIQNSARSQVIAKLKAKKGKIKEVTKKVVSSGFLSDEEFCELLELEEETKTIVEAKVTRVIDGTDKNKVPYIIFNFVITAGPHRGIAFSKYITIDLKDEERMEREVRTFCGFAQNLGYDTTEWDDDVIDKMYETVDEISADKPACRMSLSKYVPESGDRTYLNMYVIGLMDAETEDEEPEETEEPEDEPKAKPKAKPKATQKKTGKPAKVKEPEPEPEVEEESEGDDTDWSEWIGYSVSFTDEDEGTTIEGTTTSYDADANTFVVEDANGDNYEVFPDDLSWGE